MYSLDVYVLHGEKYICFGLRIFYFKTTYKNTHSRRLAKPITSFVPPLGKQPYLTEAKLLDIIEKCKTEGSYSLLIRTLGEVFSCKESLSISFQKTEKSNSPLTALLERAPDTLLRPPADMNKEAVRSLQGEDKDEDSSDPSPTVPNNDDTSVDLPSVRRAFEALWSLPGIKIHTTILLNILYVEFFLIYKYFFI